MIVKNESHIILNTLENLCSYITFAYWVISDTGSTDATKSIITDFFKQKNIPGELVEHEWKDFGYNRTKALECAYNKSDYIFIFDADDKIFGEFKLPNIYDVDRYQVKFGPHVVYTRPLLVTNRKKWCFTGVLHESLSNIDVMNGEKTLEGEYYIESGRTGNRSKNPTKYLDDAIVLKNAFTTTLTSDYGLACRYAFYCGQSYKDAGPQYMDDAIEWYKKCLDLGNWAQEKYYACLMIGNLYKIKNDIPNTMKYWYKTVEYDIERMEGVVWAMKQLMAEGQNLVVNALYHKFKDYNKKPEHKLFIFENDYNDEIEYHNSVCAFYVNDKASGYECCKKIILNNVISYGYLKSTLSNTLFYKDLLEKDTATSEMFYSVDNALHTISSLHKEQLDPKMIELWSLLFEKNRKKLTLYNKFSFTPRRLPKIFLSFTTCKRVDLFKQTVNSILNHWTDIDKVDYWFCVDDNSSEEDRVKMTSSYPWINYRMKTPEEKGHRQSMNIIWDKLKELGPVYWIHMEDDFLFHTKMNYVGEAISALTQMKDEKVHQILFNRNYGETIEDYKVLGHNETSSTIVVHDYKLGTFPYSNCHYWPHYSFRPAVIDVKTVLELGNFDSENQFFEMDYAKKWYAAGYKSGFFNRITNRHIGRLTSERHLNTVKNAYDLNDVSQFQQRDISRSSSSSSIKIVNLERRPDRKEATIQKMMDADIDKTSYDFVKAVDGLQLQPTEELKQIFEGNDFGSRKGVIGCALSHLKLWKQLLTDVNNEYYIIMEDDFSLSPNFKSEIETLQSELLSKDLIFLGYHMFEKHRDQNKHIYEYNTSEQKSTKIEPLNKIIYIGGTHCYSINKKGAQILVHYISEHGCKHGIDYVMKLVPNLSCFETQPQLAFALWNEAGAEIDTDIQNCNDRLDFTKIKDKYCLPYNYIIRPDNNADNELYSTDEYQKEVYVYVKKIMQERNFKTVIDIGCGSGYKLINYLGDFDTIGIETEPCYSFMTNKYPHRKWFNSGDPNKSFVFNENIPNKIDIIISVDVIEHILEPELLLDFCKQFQAKYYVFSTPCRHVLSTHQRFANAGYHSHSNGPPKNVHHVREWTFDEFKKYLSKHFNVLESFLGTNQVECQWHLCEKIENKSAEEMIDIDTIINNASPTPFDILENKIQLIKKMYVFIPNIDQLGNDTYYHKKLLHEYFAIASNDKNCVGFNTLGFFKNKIDTLTRSQYFGKGDGIYIKNEYYNRMISKNDPTTHTDAKRIRVKMLCNWCSSEQLCKEWANMCDDVTRFQWKNIEMTWTDKREEIDYYVIINSPPPNSYFEPLKTIVFQMEPWVNDSTKPWGVKTWGKWAEPNPAEFLAVRGRKTPHHNNAFWQLELTYNQLLNLKITEEKQHIISSICSSKYFDEGHIARIDLLKYIEQKNDPNVQIDIYNQDNVHNFKNFNGPVSPYVDKSKGMLQYKYYFMIENNYEENFITEKIWEPILCESLVFYYGCPNITDYIDSCAFVLLDVNDFEKSYQIIKQAIEEDWHTQRIGVIRQEKHKILNKLAFFPTIENIITKNIENPYSNLYNTYFEEYNNKNYNNLLKFLHNYHSSAWLGHLQFAMWLVNKYKPKVTLELGVDYGHSAFAFASEGIGNVYGIDCFEGDIHAGHRDTLQTLNDTKKYLLDNQLLVRDNLFPIKGYFDEIYKSFNHTIDILHIDGLHTYEAVSNDFNTWINKTHDNSIILMHDVISFRDSVGKFFDEIPYPKTFFSHSAGLGVVSKNQSIIDDINNIWLNNNHPNPNNPKKYCFIHSCHLKEVGINILNELISNLIDSNSIQYFEKIFVVNIGEKINPNDFNHSKIQIINYSDNVKLFEIPTINLIRTFCEYSDNCEILYLHTKGVTCPNSKNVIDWKNMMTHFLVNKCTDCFELLKKYDTVGCNYTEAPHKHYSGNFWWANSSYIKRLSKIPCDSKRHDAEWWILSNDTVNSCEIHHSGINHYLTEYSSEKYI